jgi:hypothetical protein
MTIFDKVGCTEVSMTPLCMSQWCQWHHYTYHSGVTDSAVHVTGVSLTLLCMSQRCQWHRCATNFVDLLRKYEAIFKKALTRVSGAKGELFDEKTEVKNLMSGSL